MHRLATVLALLFASPALAVQPDEILPKGVAYDPAIPTPEKVLGFRVGERHLQHHELLGYVRKLAEESPRVTVAEYARSFGGRSLVYATITSPENHRRLEEIRKAHLARADGSRAEPVADGTTEPAVVVMGYGVHGNEPSASNAAALVAYHLAAGTGKDHDKLLSELVILLDPCLNPDGFERFAHWANDNRGAVASADPATREHREAWPGGRTNYYWFDLNRDWLPVQMPESRGRLAVYHQWKPNLVFDFHEMGSTSTYFFQPGDPKRVHPLVPARNQELTQLLARKHAAALDKLGSLYFTEEQFDDFYPGKGSTYPDLHGGVGVLFEQASSRGQVQETPGGRLTFPFTIRNQFTTSLTSLAGVQGLRPAFLEYQRQFYRAALDEAAKGPVKGYLVAVPYDRARLHAFLDVLHAHAIRAYRTEPTWDFGPGVRKGDVYWIPTNQPESRFLQALFEKRTEFAGSTFYDISAWSLPLAFGVAVKERREDVARGEPYTPGPVAPAEVEFAADDVGYLIDWRCLEAPATLAKLLAAGVKVRVAGKEFTAAPGREKLPPGTLAVPLGIQPDKRAAVVEILEGAAAKGVAVVPLRTGLTPEGPDLGSSSFVPVPSPRLLLVLGEGTSAYEAGEAWHALDRRIGLPVALVETTRLGSVDLDKYSVVVLVSGTYAGVGAATVEKLKDYATHGGTLLAIGTSITWLKARGIVAAELRLPKPAPSERRPFNEAGDDANRRLIRGAIFATNVDATHPLGYGCGPEPLAVFRTNSVVLERSANPYGTPAVYTDRPLLAGYASTENQDRLAGSGAAVVVGVGSGRALLLPDDPNFRAHWLGSQWLFFNAVFFGPTVRIPGGAGTAEGHDHQE